MSAPPGDRGLGPPFWRLFASSSVSNLSDGVLVAAAPLLVASLTREPVLVSLMSTLTFLPWLLFALPAGALVDRTDRQRAMVTGQLLRVAVLVVLTTTTALGGPPLWLVYVLTFLLGTVETVYDSAARAMLPSVVRRDQLERGNSLLTTAESVGNIFLGAPAGAALFALAAFAPFATTAAGYLLAALALVGLRRGRGDAVDRDAPGTTADRSLRREMGQALRWLWHHGLLRSLLLTTTGSGIAQSAASGMLVLFALQDLGLSESGYGLLLAVAGVGAVLGSLLSPRLAASLGRPAAMGLSEMVSATALGVMALWQHPVVGMVGFAVSAGCISAFNVQVMSLRQAVIPEALFGRVQGAYRTVLWGGIPVGTLLGGVIAGVWSVPGAFLVAGAAGVVVGALTWLVLLRHRDEVDAAFREPSPAGQS